MILNTKKVNYNHCLRSIDDEYLIEPHHPTKTSQYINITFYLMTQFSEALIIIVVVH